MKKINLLTLVFIGVSVLFSCETISTISKINNTEVHINEIKNRDKEVSFVEMIHIGKKEFYKNVVSEVKNAKQNGAVLFYEYIDYMKCDTLILRKTQKMVGFVPSPENYALVVKDILENDSTLTVQDNKWFLNLVNKNDFNIDYTPERIIKEYEEKYGDIKLSQNDLSIGLDDINKKTLPKKQVYEIILNHRNSYLAKQIHESLYKKIIVLYGGDHFKGMYEELQKLDKNWQKVKK